jgi:hypothetical protein
MRPTSACHIWPTPHSAPRAAQLGARSARARRAAHVDDDRVDVELVRVLVDEALALVPRREEDDRRAREQPAAQVLPVLALRRDEPFGDLGDEGVVDCGGLGRDFLDREGRRERARRRDELLHHEMLGAHRGELRALKLGLPRARPAPLNVRHGLAALEQPGLGLLDLDLLVRLRARTLRRGPGPHLLPIVERAHGVESTLHGGYDPAASSKVVASFDCPLWAGHTRRGKLDAPRYQRVHAVSATRPSPGMFGKGFIPFWFRALQN